MSPDQIASYAVGVIALAGAVFERVRGRKRDEMALVSAAKNDVIETVTKDRDEWKRMCADREKQMQSYRDETHTRLDKAHADLMKISEENGRLKAATDLTPVLEQLREMGEFNKQVITGLSKILKHLDRLEEGYMAAKARSGHHAAD